MNHSMVRFLAFDPAATSNRTASVVQLSHVSGAAAVTAISRVKGLSSADRFLLSLGAWTLGSVLAHELGGKKAAKEFTIGMLAGAVQLAA